jgi:hypothetical protein
MPELKFWMALVSGVDSVVCILLYRVCVSLARKVTNNLIHGKQCITFFSCALFSEEERDMCKRIVRVKPNIN